MKKAWHNVTLEDLGLEFNQGNIESNKVKEEHGGPKKCWASLRQHQPTKYPTYGIKVLNWELLLKGTRCVPWLRA